MTTMTTNEEIQWDNLVTARQVSDALGIPITGVWKHMERGNIPTYRKTPRARQSYMDPEDVRRVYPRLPQDMG